MSKIEQKKAGLDLGFYLNIIKQMPGLIVVMDRDSKFLYSNDYTAEMFGYKNEESMRGINAHDMRCEASSSAEEFIKQDNFVIQHEKKLTIFDIHGYADGKTKILLTKKSPFYLDGELGGTICFCTEVKDENISDISALLLESDKKYVSKQDSRSYTVNDFVNEAKLSDRERDCIFYMLRGYSMKEIGKHLEISWRTVESYINNIKFKWGCQNKKAVIDCAVAHGYLNYIPKNLLSVNLSRIIHEEDA